MKLFVWDFHGVLEKGAEKAFLDLSTRALKESGYSRFLTEKEIETLWGSKLYQYFAYLLPEKPMKTHLALQDRCTSIEEDNPEILKRHLKPNDYAHEVLENIANKHDQILISNTLPKTLLRFLAAVDMLHYFPDGKRFGITGAATVQKTKKNALADYLSEKSFDGICFDNIITIGDFPGDIELVEVAGGTSYLYAHPGREFRSCNPDYRIRDLRKILREL